LCVAVATVLGTALTLLMCHDFTVMRVSTNRTK
jgi:hypothetical protein